MTIDTKAKKPLRTTREFSGASTGKPNEQKSKSALAREAKERGEDRFTAVCTHHGETAHYSASAKCVACQAVKKAKRTERLRSDPQAREARNEYQRQLHATSEQVRGTVRERDAAKKWRERTGGSMHGWYHAEREALQQKYKVRRDGFEMDHGIPKIAYGLIDGKREHVVTGLHCFSNVIETPTAVNQVKRTQFAPETNRLQRPANRLPGGAFDPEPTEHERSLIEQAEALGTPEEICLETLRADLDRKARAYEAHAEMIEAKLTERRNAAANEAQAMEAS